MDEHNFKLLAIRPLVGCERKFAKSLKLGVIYKLYNEYDYLGNTGSVVGVDEDDENEVANVVYNSKIPPNLYTVKTGDGRELQVNISAVVGKNGAGKSTLLELLYTLSYSIAIKEELISDLLYNLKRFKETGDHFFSDRVHEIQSTVDDLFLEIYYSKGDSIFMLRNEKVSYSLYELDGKWRQIDSSRINYLFYTIVINYSIYALNSSLNNNFWLNSLFHKNDGYKTPIVINPFRVEGNIDINTEFHLAQTRILSNLSGEYLSGNYIVANKRIIALEFNILPEQLESFDNISFKNIFELYEKENEESVVQLFAKLCETLVNYKIESQKIGILEQLLEKDLEFNRLIEKYTYKDYDEPINNEQIIYLSLKYAIRKIFRICRQYDDFRGFYGILSKDKPVPKLNSISKLIIALKEDNSHITIKLKQILYSVKENYFDGSWMTIRNPKNSNHKAYRYSLDIDTFLSIIKLAQKNNPDIETEQLLPVAFFKPNFILTSEDATDSELIFQTLSSGEQQIIQSIQSIIYHLVNLNSVFSSYSADKIRYEYVNIILDEIELYYHPEYQKKYIAELLKSISKVTINNIKGINLLFSTHSPFLLSDIPNENILRLKKGEIVNSSEPTFGSNIYDLLANDFFISDGFIGDYSLSEIRKILDYTQSGIFNEKIHNYSLEIVNLIGDEVIKNKLLQLLDEIESLRPNEEQLIMLEKQLREIETKIKNITGK